MRKIALVSLALTAALSLTACGADVAGACENYFSSIESCTVEYADANDIDASTLLLDDSFCDDTYGELKDQESADYLNCLADVYDSADCSTADGYGAAGTAAAADCAL